MAKYAVQIFVNRKYVTITESAKATAGHLSSVMDKFIAFNRTADLRVLSSGREIDSLGDRPTRLVRFPTDGGKMIVLRKGRTAPEKIAA
jgi:hypothetical protein